MKSSKQQAASTLPSGSEPDFVLAALQKYQIPVTRENYLGLAYPEGLPEEWSAADELTLPQEIRQA
jgi:hypothetical protein